MEFSKLTQIYLCALIILTHVNFLTH